MRAPRRTEMEVYLSTDPSSFGPLVDVAGMTHIRLNAEDLVCHSATSDAASSENDPSLRWRKATRKRPNCPLCLRVVQACAPWA